MSDILSEEMKRKIQELYDRSIGMKKYTCYPLITFLLLFISCATSRYAFIGDWFQMSGTRTYVNLEQHISLTFPNEEWRVYTTPNKELEANGIVWNIRPSYHVLFAISPSTSAIISAEIHPVRGSKGLDYLMETWDVIYKGRPKFGVHNYWSLEESTTESLRTLSKGIISRRGKNMAAITFDFIQQYGADIKINGVLAGFSDPDRFTVFMLVCPETTYEMIIDDFWRIVDSYEYIIR